MRRLWQLDEKLVVAFVFVLMFGAVRPGEILPVTLLAAVMLVAWLVHAWPHHRA